jgi:signal transduction histidine kinase
VRHSVQWRDGIGVAVLTIATWILCGLLNVTETLRRLTAPYERYQLDELPTVLLVLGLGLTWFALRRYREARQEITRRKSAEAQLTAALADNRRLAQQYVALQEAERKTLARELHDELGQYLNVIKLDAVQIRDDRRADLAATHSRAGAIVEHCTHIHRALATLIRELRPAGLDELGLAAALEHCIQTWRSRLPAVALHLSISGDFTALPEDLAVTVYRLVQEALTNVAKHAAAERVDVHLVRTGTAAGSDDRVTVSVTDDGIGAQPARIAAGLGLIGMRERVTAQHGELTVRSPPGGGFQLLACIPTRAPPGDPT